MIHMDLLNGLKIGGALFTFLWGMGIAYIQLKKNLQSWLKRYFAGFFSSTAIGFLLYTLYHLMFQAPNLIIPMMILAQVFFNLGMTCLLLVVLIVEYGEITVFDKKLYLFPFILFVISLIGYVIWPPTLNQEDLENGLINTETTLILLLIVNLFRLFIVSFAIIKFWLLAKNSEDNYLKKRLLRFSYGLIIILLGILLNLLGGSLKSIGIFLEILGLAGFDIGAFIIFQGLIQKIEEKKETE